MSPSKAGNEVRCVDGGQIGPAEVMLALLHRWWKGWGGRKPLTDEFGDRGRGFKVLSIGLPAAVYRDNDLDTIETELQSIIEAQGLGEYDGNEIGEAGATLFMYGPDGERLFAGVEAALRAYPLCKNARVLIRPGPPGTPPREVRL